MFKVFVTTTSCSLYQVLYELSQYYVTNYLKIEWSKITMTYYFSQFYSVTDSFAGGLGIIESDFVTTLIVWNSKLHHQFTSVGWVHEKLCLWDQI